MAHNAGTIGDEAKAEAKLASKELGEALGVSHDQRRIRGDAAHGQREEEVGQGAGAMDGLRQHDALWTKKLATESGDSQRESQADPAGLGLRGSHIATSVEADGKGGQGFKGSKVQRGAMAADVDPWQVRHVLKGDANCCVRWGHRQNYFWRRVKISGLVNRFKAVF